MPFEYSDEQWDRLEEAMDRHPEVYAFVAWLVENNREFLSAVLEAHRDRRRRAEEGARRMLAEDEDRAIRYRAELLDLNLEVRRLRKAGLARNPYIEK